MDSRKNGVNLTMSLSNFEKNAKVMGEITGQPDN